MMRQLLRHAVVPTFAIICFSLAPEIKAQELTESKAQELIQNKYNFPVAVSRNLNFKDGQEIFEFAIKQEISSLKLAGLLTYTSHPNHTSFGDLPNSVTLHLTDLGRKYVTSENPLAAKIGDAYFGTIIRLTPAKGIRGYDVIFSYLYRNPTPFANTALDKVLSEGEVHYGLVHILYNNGIWQIIPPLGNADGPLVTNHRGDDQL